MAILNDKYLGIIFNVLFTVGYFLGVIFFVCPVKMVATIGIPPILF
jgi:hypothetical protein